MSEKRFESERRESPGNSKEVEVDKATMALDTRDQIDHVQSTASEHPEGTVLSESELREQLIREEDQNAELRHERRREEEAEFERKVQEKFKAVGRKSMLVPGPNILTC